MKYSWQREEIRDLIRSKLAVAPLLAGPAGFREGYVTGLAQLALAMGLTALEIGLDRGAVVVEMREIEGGPNARNR